MGAGKSLRVGQLARLSSLTGLGLADLGEMSESQLVAVQEVALEEQQRRAWSQDTELLATAVELLQAILARLDAGIPVGLTKGLGKPAEPPTIKRPEWVKAPPEADPSVARGDEVVMSPREFFASMRRR